MKLATYSTQDNPAPRPGLLIETDRGASILDLCAYAPAEGMPQSVDAILSGGAETLGRVKDALDAARKDSASVAPFLTDEATALFHPPLTNPGKVMCIGANYPAHVEEIAEQKDQAEDVAAIGKQLSSGEYPPAFLKVKSSLAGHRMDVKRPEGATTFDYEAELALVIGKTRADAGDDILDMLVAAAPANDLSVREVQFREMKRGLLLSGKNFPGACPIGPYVTTLDDIADVQNLRIECSVNGDLRQSDNTSRMLFNIRQILEYYADLPLLPGDIVLTGSPAGVAVGMDVPADYYLNDGDTVVVSIEGLGNLESRIVS
ncbi:MAG: fumarylacetoacetate hydrolase family protein [Pelagimonas sp.]|uniref:fumarylacetoacetate hydrolase family protein n=1 Tax=Pelagimonas sp. TaxID=2073170 RepID=UPI003D6A282A